MNPVWTSTSEHGDWGGGLRRPSWAFLPLPPPPSPPSPPSPCNHKGPLAQEGAFEESALHVEASEAGFARRIGQLLLSTVV